MEKEGISSLCYFSLTREAPVLQHGHKMTQRVETGPPPSLLLFLKRSSFSVTKPDHYFCINRQITCVH